MEWEDLMQEGYLVFMRCEAKYPVIDTPQHFMALFKRAWANAFTDLSLVDSALKTEVSDQGYLVDGEGVMEFAPLGETDNEGYLAIKLSQAPREVKMVLNLLLSAPPELLAVVMQGWNGIDGRRHDGGSSRICAALGLPAGQNVMAEVYNYLRHT